MKKRSDGNGHDKFVISVTDKNGRLVVCPDHLIANHPQTAILISRTLESYLDEHPDYHVRASTGIVLDGQTVALHVWYDRAI